MGGGLEKNNVLCFSGERDGVPVDARALPHPQVAEWRDRRQQVRRYKATWKREFKLPWRKAGLIVSMIKWTRTSRLSIQISLTLRDPFAPSVSEQWQGCSWRAALIQREKERERSRERARLSLCPPPREKAQPAGRGERERASEREKQQVRAPPRREMRGFIVWWGGWGSKLSRRRGVRTSNSTASSPPTLHLQTSILHYTPQLQPQTLNPNPHPQLQTLNPNHGQEGGR